MVLRVHTDDIDGELLAFVRSWFDLIAQGEIEKACALIDKPNSYGIRWTPEMIVEALLDHFGPGTIFAKQHPEGPFFTAPSKTGGNLRADVVPFSDGSGFSVWHDVPLNGESSELTAQFEFIGKAPEFEVILHDLQVL